MIFIEKVPNKSHNCHQAAQSADAASIKAERREKKQTITTTGDKCKKRSHCLRERAAVAAAERASARVRVHKREQPN